MSWIERISNEMIIVTGDGKEYRPMYLNAERETQFHTSQFEFVNKRGTLVHRGKDKGKVYTLELYFQGEDNLDVATAFDKSTLDSRPWTISHPLYDSITVQPVRIHQDNTLMNVTKFSCAVMETITEKLPASTVAPKEQLDADIEDSKEAIAQEFAGENFTTTDSTILTSNNIENYNQGKKGLLNNIDAQLYYNQFKQANAAILNVSSAPLLAMRKIQAMIESPALFVDSVENRLATLENQYLKLRTSISNITTRKKKVAFEAYGVGTALAIITAAISGSTASTIGEVLTIATRVSNNYDLLLTDLDSLQSTNGGEVNSYIPNGELLQKLTSATNFSLAFLKQISLGKSIERSIILEEDSNLISLTHRFYGLDLDDENLNTFMNINNIGLNEMLFIRKGRTIKYLI